MYKVLIDAGADPNVRNSRDQGIAEKALEDENESLLIFLIENGYIKDPNLKFTPGQFELSFNYDNPTEEEGEENEENI